jgi:hypothetical protein
MGQVLNLYGILSAIQNRILKLKKRFSVFSTKNCEAIKAKYFSSSLGALVAKTILRSKIKPPS